MSSSWFLSQPFDGECPPRKRPAAVACQRLVGCVRRCMSCVLQLERLGVAETGSRDGKRPGLLQRRRVAAPSAGEDSNDSQSDADGSAEDEAEGGGTIGTAAVAGRKQSSPGPPAAASRAQTKAASPDVTGVQPGSEAAEQPAAKRRRVSAEDVKAVAAAAKLELGLPGVAALFTL